MVRQKTDLFEQLLYSYLSKLQEIASHPDSSNELSYRPALNILLEGLSEALDKKEMSVITEPLRKAYGTPDYKLKTGKDFLIGYVEAKGLSSNVQDLSESEQIERYCASGQRLILTNHLEFVLYDFVSSKKESPVLRVDQVKLLGKKEFLAKKTPHRADIHSLRKLFDRFLRESRPEIDGAYGLAKCMANIAHIIRDSIGYEFQIGTASKPLQDLHRAFQEILIPDLKTHLLQNEKFKGILTSFDDMYAQTIVYGLFAARCNHEERRGIFTRRLAAYDLPKTNPFLKKLFEQIVGPDIEDEPFCWAVDDLAHLLATVDMEAVLYDFGKRTQREDPVVHFYETFLKEYNPKLREARGVYYTPEAVVSYIVCSVDYLLKTKFNRPKGLVDENTLILDPACGTGTFLYAVIDHIRRQFKENKGKWSGYVKKHILARLFGFELLMAPYSVAHMKLGLQLDGADMPEEIRNDWKYDFSGNERLGIFLTNTLEEAFKKSEKIFASWISDEAESAARIKRDMPIMVVLGNPPYQGMSANRSTEIVGGKEVPNFIGKLLREYYFVDDKPLGEKNPRWLQDDYVKFIRFGQWRIEQTGKGILAFITNHGYLDNPTFRGMRQHLMNTFTNIYILDLHGNAKKKEKCPDGTKDVNVFDIQQGVAIGIFIKEKGIKGPAKVNHINLWGLRDDKYKWLWEHDINTVTWNALRPQSPFYLFTPLDTNFLDEYNSGWKITDVFQAHNVGIITKRDSLTIHWDEEQVWKTVKDFSDLPAEEARDKYELGHDVRDWKVEWAQRDLKESGPSKSKITPVLYRPFDVRYTYYTGKSRGFLGWPFEKIMSHMSTGDNIAIITSRLTKGEKFAHVQATRNIAEVICMSSKTSNNGFFFPLYLYPQTEIERIGGVKRFPNLTKEFIRTCSTLLKTEFIFEGKGDLVKTIGPEDIFAYIYAVLHSPTYRNRYENYLRLDFPRIPLTSSQKLFKALSKIGSNLLEVHLLESSILDDPLMQPTYPIKGDNKVEVVKYKNPGEKVSSQREPLKKGRVYINKVQYFEGIALELWNFHIGGYQVCQKWLKDRKNRILSYTEITRYQKVVVAIKQTINLMNEIDNAITEWPIK